MSALAEEDAYFFDLNGYVVVPNMLAADEVERLLRVVESNDSSLPGDEVASWAQFLDWDPRFLGLMADERVVDIVIEMCGPRARLDSAMAYKTSSSTASLELHRSWPEGEPSYTDPSYNTDWRIPRCGSLVVQWALTDVPDGAGGLCCIPGSHKALQGKPGSATVHRLGRLVRQIPHSAGDVVIFTEALLHGTAPWTAAHTRRAIVFKYCPGNQIWNHHQPLLDATKECDLSPLQSRLLAAPYVFDRPTVRQDSDPA
jgi:hypothetical protein